MNFVSALLLLPKGTGQFFAQPLSKLAPINPAPLSL